MKKKLIFCKFALLVLYLAPGFIIAEGLFLPMSFDDAMVSVEEHRERYNEFKLNTPHHFLLELIEKQYYQFIDIAKQIPNTLKIPKIIHQIWIGPLPFPQEARQWQESWAKLHPDWEYKLWTNKEVESFDFANKKFYEEATNWGEKSDILRYELLYLYGGLYVDVDFECQRSSLLDELHHICDFYSGIHMVPLLVENRLRINNGLLAARPQHPIIAQARNQIRNFRHESSIVKRTGPDFFTAVIDAVLPWSLTTGSVDMVFPSNFFYPSGPKGGAGYKIKDGQAYIRPETIAVHYYTSYWIIKPKEPKTPENTQHIVSISEPKEKKKADPKRLEKRYQEYLAKKNAHKIIKQEKS